MSRLEQQRFTISELADDWHELMIPWRIMRPSIARDGKQLDPRCSPRTYHRPISALGLHPVARELLLISRPAEGRRLSWPEHTVRRLAASLLKVACRWPRFRYLFLFLGIACCRRQEEENKKNKNENK